MFTYVIPSRGRPENVDRQIRAWDLTWDGVATPFYVFDDDDPTLGEYERVLREHNFTYVDYAIVPRMRLGPTLNHVVQNMCDNIEVFGFMGDDHVPRSAGWDRKLYDICLLMKMGVAYGNDKIQGSNLPTAVALTGNIVRTLGYMVPPGLIHLFLDNFWLELGRRIGIAYKNDVIIEHVHPITRAAAWDDVYRECNSPEQWTNDERAWKHYRDTQFESDVAKLIAMKEML